MKLLSNFLFDEIPVGPSTEEDGGSDDDQILTMALQKLEQAKAKQPAAAKQPSVSAPKVDHKKAKKKSLLPPPPQFQAPKAAPQVVKTGAKLTEEEAMKEVETQLMLDDYAKNIKLIWSSDRQASVKPSYQSVQWHKFKNGAKNRLYNYIITDQ